MNAIAEKVHVVTNHCEKDAKPYYYYLLLFPCQLFTLLISTKIPGRILGLIIDSYVRQSTGISWNNVYTNYVQLLNGVKQGGVLSAKLFTLYIDGLFTELKHSGYGCHINNTYMGALSYADDI